ncbi:acyl-CoA dehydrogenase family protein [Streptomyces sp. NPDC051572]|uniref:acyl-CoA dehydrogenase family protein n=1 Tax=unclassified Streptomyces TaxID=2593676 RepID=UPI00344CF211
MFDLSLTVEQQRISTELRDIAVERLRPLAAEAEARLAFPETIVKTLEGIDWLPGSDAFAAGTEDPLSFCLAAEGLAWADPALAHAWVTSRQVSWLIAACGSAAQREKYLPPLARSPLAPANLLLFEGYGRAPSELEATARRDGEGWIVSAEKTAVAFAGRADISVLIARDEDGELIGFVIEDPAGSVRFEGEHDRRLALGAVGLATRAVVDELHIGPEAVLERSGLAAAIGVCRLAQAAVSLGAAESATRYAADWGLNRTAFGRPLVGFQGVAFPLANLFMEAESTRTALQEAVATLATADDAEERTSRTVAQVNHLVRNASREGIELMGVHGVITDHPVERIYRSAAVLASIDFDPLINLLVLSNS